MTKRFLKILAFTLAAVFLMPTVIRFLDTSFHHHYTFHDAGEKQNKVLHLYHHACPIPGFQLSSFSFQKQIHPAGAMLFYEKIMVLPPHRGFSSGFEFSNLLRAPPISKTFLS